MSRSFWCRSFTNMTIMGMTNCLDTLVISNDIRWILLFQFIRNHFLSSFLGQSHVSVFTCGHSGRASKYWLYRNNIKKTATIISLQFLLASKSHIFFEIRICLESFKFLGYQIIATAFFAFYLGLLQKINMLLANLG